MRILERPVTTQMPMGAYGPLRSNWEPPCEAIHEAKTDRAFRLLSAVMIRVIPAPRNGCEARFSSLGAG
jgi:hypothetical protein